MAIAYDRGIIASAPFKFIVGPHKKLFTVHNALVAHHSKPLGVLVNGEMLEAREGCALLEEINEETFVRFSQYVYTGDYVAADPEIILDSSTIAICDGDTEESARDGAGATLTKSKAKSKEKATKETTSFGFGEFSVSKKSELCESFYNRLDGYSGPTFQARKNREACENYTDVFMCHAQVYVFAEKYDIRPLKNLSLYKLSAYFDRLVLYNERVRDIVGLISYSYANTPDGAGHMDDLSELVVHYAECVVEDLAHDASFKTLLEEVGSFARDLVGQMLK